MDFLYNLAAGTAFVAPPGADAGADFGGWRSVFAKGEPYGSAARQAVAELSDFHGAFSALGSATPPLLLEAGYADDVTGTLEVLRVYRRLMAAHTGPVAMQLGDVGHFRATNPPATTASLLTAPSFDKLARRMRTLRTRGSHLVTSKGGSAALAFGLTPRLGGSTSCARFRRDRSRAVTAFTWPSRGATLAGSPTVAATIRARGSEGQLAFRLWDLAPGGSERLVVRGAYRVTKSQHGRIQVPLGIGCYRFPPRDRIRLEVLGRDAGFLRPSNGRFSIRLAKVGLALPVR